MRRARPILICALFCGSLLATPSVAVAGGCNNSAANTQYVDPLSCQNHPSHKGSQTTPASQPTTPAPAASAPSSTPTSTPTATTASGKSDPTSKSSKTLPFTGLNLWPAVLIGIGLLALGLVLRRRALDVRRWH